MNQHRVPGIAVVAALFFFLSQVLAGSPSAISADMGAPENDVDLRATFEKWGLGCRLQGTRGTCSVFAVAGALEYALANKTGQSRRLSVEYLNWASNQATGKMRDGGFFSDLWRGFETWGICPEDDMPYRNAFDPKLAPSDEAKEHAGRLREAGLRLHWIKPWNVNTGLTEAQSVEIKQVLRRGWPVCGGLRWPMNVRWKDDVLQMAPPDGVVDGHSVLIVGHRDDPEQPGGGVFVFRNSSNNGREGLMTYEYAGAYMNDAVWIDCEMDNRKAAISPSPAGVSGSVVFMAGVSDAGILAGHPRLLGDRTFLQDLAKQRPQAYDRMEAVARGQGGGDYEKMISMALVCVIEADKQLGLDAIAKAMTYVNGPIRKGHVTFATDLALCALMYDLCYDYWTIAQRQAFWEYMNETVDANVHSETHVFHNGWYGYKHWGIGLACYATMGENPRAPEILKTLETDWKTRAAPALEMAGAGGGWAEGYYINYWLYEWLFFCEVAQRCGGVDYYSDAPSFFKNRAAASMFEAYPGIGIYGSRRAVPMGDGGGRTFGGDRDKILSARRILASHYRNDGEHQVVGAFNETTPRSSVGMYAYKDFLWRDESPAKGDMKEFRLSHISDGPGYVYARSSWDEDATYFFFKCGDRFTAHQHLDEGHFVIYKYQELVGDGGHYDNFGSSHDVNYHLRTIAHNTILVYDPNEKWPGIRAGNVTGNDGGQHHNWPHHNGAVSDPQQWRQQRQLYDIADITAFEDCGGYLYVAGDYGRAYSHDKVEFCTRQIVYIRPGTFVIFDRVGSTNANFQKTWLLQAMKTPQQQGEHLVVTNGKGRLFVQRLLPAEADVRCVSGEQLYSYGGRDYPPSRDTGPAPECRIEVSPRDAHRVDYFCFVLTAGDAAVSEVKGAKVVDSDSTVTVDCGGSSLRFDKAQVGGAITVANQTRPLAAAVVKP
jgi:hypothetical protein